MGDAVQNDLSIEEHSCMPRLNEGEGVRSRLDGREYAGCAKGKALLGQSRRWPAKVEELSIHLI